MRRTTTVTIRRPSAPSVVSFLVVGGVIAFTAWQLHPSLLLANTTVAGGDTGSQVGLPYYFEHGILAHFHITGWSPWWFDGFPQYTFYFPLPAIFVAVLNLVMPYNVAFKLITVAGSLLLPVAAWAFGRLTGMRRPGPELLAVLCLPYLFEFSFPTTYQIVGGNLASTLAGEYSYSLSLVFGLLFLGVVWRGMDTGKRRGLAAVLLAATALCHIVPAIFVGAVAVVITIIRFNRRRLRWSITAALSGVAILGFWIVPFAAGLPYTSSLGFSTVTAYMADMFPPGLLPAVVLGSAGALISLVRRRPTGTLLAAMAGVSAILIRFDPTKALYNARFLPLWVLSVYLLAAVGVNELVNLSVEAWIWWRSRRGSRADLGESVLAALAAVQAEGVRRLQANPEQANPEQVRAILEAQLPLARDRAALAVDPTELGERQREKARVAIELDRDLARAYELKEAFVAASRLALAEPTLAMAAVELWAALAQGSGIGPFAKLGQRVRVWRPEVETHLRLRRPGRGLGPRLGKWRSSQPAPAVLGYRRPPDPARFTWAPVAMALVTPVVAWLVVAGLVVAPLGLSWMPMASTASYIPDWVHWNYSGYQGKATYPEYRAINTTMARVGAKYGCGRAMWEYGPELNDLGTTEALMLLPFWTHGCIDSMEGLLFESSATTPYHFINQAELSQTPSEPETGLPYGPLDVSLGVAHLQLLGVRYYMAFTPAAEAQANADPALRLVATTGPWSTAVGSTTLERTWDIYVVANSSTVTPLDTRPVVLTGVNKRSPQSWLEASLNWYDNPSLANVMEAETGPSSWARVPAGAQSLPAAPVTPTTVTGIIDTNTTVSFHVTTLGSPVLVKTSYYPNWHASGASGPYRVSPNLMVVVPTSHHVTLSYTKTGADWIGILLSLAGLIGAAWMAWRPPVPMPEPRPLARAELGLAGPEAGEGTGAD